MTHHVDNMITGLEFCWPLYSAGDESDVSCMLAE